jgi:GAF domain-containing protein/HAMP domain-containing protein
MNHSIFISLRTKLFLTFWGIVFIPLAILTLLSDNSTRNALTNAAEQSLSAAASQTANSLDAFIVTNLNDISTAAQLPDFAEYLALSPSERLTNTDINQIHIADILRSLARKDQLHPVSYALLDSQGQDIVDTSDINIGTDESAQDYFKETSQTVLPYVSPVEFSPKTQGGIVHFSSSVRDAAGTPIGVLLARYPASILQDIIRQNASLVQNSNAANAPQFKVFGVLFDENHMRLGHSAAPELIFKTVVPLDPNRMAQLTAAGRSPNLATDQLSTNLPELEQNLTNAVQQPLFTSQEFNTGNEVNQTAVAQVKSLPWLVAFFQPRNEFLKPADDQTQNLVKLALGIFLLVSVMAVFVARQLSNPIKHLTDVAEKVSAGDLSAQAQVKSSDELGKLASAFNSTTAQLRNLIGSLEERVAARTQQLRASAEVSRAIAATLDPEKVLSQIANLISERFKFYYVAVFLLDDSGENAVLRQATGEAGRILKERGHQLAVKSASMVGTAITTRQLRIALDVGAEAVRFANPLLPETRSEIALPLIAGNRIFGALDVQSTQAAAFDEASAEVLQTMADQIAIALNNATSFVNVQAAARRAEVTATLLSSMFELTVQADQQTLYERIAQLSMEMVNADGAGLALPISDTELEIMASFYVRPNPRQARGRRLRIGEGISGQAFAARQSLRIDDYTTWSGNTDSTTDDAPYHAVVGVPLIWQNKALAVLTLTRSQLNWRFTLEDEQSLSLLATQAAASLANFNLRESQERALKELDVLNRRLTGEVWASFAQRLKREGVDWIGIGEPIGAERADQPEVAEALLTGRIAARTESSTKLAQVAVPIMLRGVSIGVIRLRVSTEDWSADTATTLTSIAGHIAQSVENARLIEQTSRTAQREKDIALAADRIHRAGDLEDVLRTTLAEVRRITGMDEIGIQIGSEPASTSTSGNGSDHPYA